MVAETGATADECIELAEALERQRTLKIVEAVRAERIGGATAGMPNPFQAGYQLACDEIAHRIETERWELVAIKKCTCVDGACSETCDNKAPNAQVEGREAGLPAERPSRSDCSAATEKEQ